MPGRRGTPLPGDDSWYDPVRWDNSLHAMQGLAELIVVPILTAYGCSSGRCPQWLRSNERSRKPATPGEGLVLVGSERVQHLILNVAVPRQS